MFAGCKRLIENVTTKYSENDVGKSSKKTGYFTVRLTVRVNENLTVITVSFL